MYTTQTREDGNSGLCAGLEFFDNRGLCSPGLSVVDEYYFTGYVKLRYRIEKSLYCFGSLINTGVIVHRRTLSREYLTGPNTRTISLTYQLFMLSSLSV